MRLTPRLAAAGLAAIACKQDYSVVAGPVEVDPEDVTECPFTPISGTKFSAYDCNPVFTGSNEDWIAPGAGVGQVGFHAEEVLGHPFYQMWYTSPGQNGKDAVGYAVSGDGVNWDPHPGNPVFEAPSSGWNQDGLGAVSVVWDATARQYVLAYQGIRYETADTPIGNGLGMLSSPDGVNWIELNGGDPMVDLGEVINGVRYCWPLTIAHTVEDGFLGYIGGSKNAYDNTCEVFGYQGPSVTELRTDPQRLLAAGPGRSDQHGVASAAVVKFDDTFYMFYVGIRDWSAPSGGFISPVDTTLHMARSSDGLEWEKSPDNPLLQLSNETTPSFLSTVAAQVVGRRIHLWITDDYAEVGQAVGYFLYEPDLVEPNP